MYDEKFMQLAIEEAHSGIALRDGGPFGAIIIRDGIMISRSHNMVIASNDPTNHAEVVAIRSASQLLGKFDLGDCEIYTTCEPCPMCLAAIYWAKIKSVYYGVDGTEAAQIGFDDRVIYEFIRNGDSEGRMTIEKHFSEECLEPMRAWMKKEDRIGY